MITVRGNIRFRGGAPDAIPDGSWLTVKLQDTARCCAPAIDLGTILKEAKDPGTLTFEITTDKRPEIPQATMSAVLNIGWKASGDEWIRRGDWLNDTVHNVDLSEGVQEYTCDVEVMHYK